MTGERGGALLEVLVAVLVLATGGLACASLVATGLETVEAARAREPRYAAAGQLLARLAGRDRRELDLRLGERSEGELLTNVQRPRPGLYRLAVRHVDAPEVDLLVTIVHRPEAR